MTTIDLNVRQPFDLQHAITHLKRFPPCGGSQFITDASLTRAVAPGTTITVTQADAAHLRVAIAGTVDVEHVKAQVSNWLSVDDDMAPFYECVKGDSARYQQHVARYPGFHHVRFFTLCEATTWFVITQRTPRNVSRGQRQKLIDAYGVMVSTPGGLLPVFPEFEALLKAGPEGLGVTINNARKGAILHEVLAGVSALDEQWLRTAPIEEARAALEAIRGVGPFTSGAILIRGLGRMEDSPIEMPSFAEEAKAVYGQFDAAAIRRRYAGHLGYWSWYLKNQ